MERKIKLHFTTLKIKVTSLAAEIRLIKREEFKAKDHARWLGVRIRLLDGNTYTSAQVERIVRRAKQRRWSRKPLTADQIETATLYRKSFEGKFDSLRGHRLTLRGETRAASLAYGFLCGVPFKAMEKYSYTKPPLERTEYHVLKFRGLETEQVVKQRFAEWVETAADWQKPKAA